MLLQLKDLASQKMISVPEEGLTFGREGGDAQVQVADMGVSKRHAEVFCEGGAWFLKDLGSSNGTLLANERIADATEILPGDVFQLSKRKFEVLEVVEEDGGDAPPEPERKAPAKLAGKPSPKPVAPPPPAKKPAGGKLPSAGAPAKEPTRAAPVVDDDDGGDNTGGGEEAGKASVGQVLASVPQAVAYYLANVPLLLINPFGTVRKGIEEQPQDAKGRIELIAWSLPGNLGAVALGFVALVISGLLSKTLSIGSILVRGLIVPAVIAVIISVAVGFLYHPVLEWVITKLQGQSDAQGRTNFFLQAQTAAIITTLPFALSAIVLAIPVPLIGLVPLVLSIAASALGTFVTYKWVSHFNVVKWFRILVLVGGALGVLFALGGIPAAIAGGASARVLSPGSNGSSGDSATGELDDTQKQAIEQMKTAGMPEETIRQAEQGYRQANALMKGAGADAQKAIEDAQKATAEAQKDAADDAKKARDDARQAGEEVKKGAGEDVKVDGKNTPAPPKDDEKPADPEPRPTAKTEEQPAQKTPPAPPGPIGSSGYAAWRAKFDAIEKRVTDDPTLLRKPNVLKLYEALQEKSAAAEAKVRKDNKKLDPRTLGHLRDAELFEQSGKEVDELSKVLGR